MPSFPHLEHLGENASLLHLGTQLDASTLEQVRQCDQLLQQSDWPELLEIVPAYASLLLHHCIAPEQREPWFRRLLELLADTNSPRQAEEQPLYEIPVHYGGQHGPDLAALALQCGLDEGEVIALHQAAEYRVAMIGFAPGFPYLSGLDPRLATARKARPLLQVPAGSVAIGGQQTGIYPTVLPGGWHIIGYTPLAMFDPHNQQRPCLLQPGDRVRFKAIDPC